MPLLELVRLSLDTFRTHRMRSFLTALGIIIGVMTVIAIVSLIQGMNYEVEKQISSLGSNTLFIQKFAFGMGRLDWDEINKRPNLTMDDALAISQLPSIYRVTASRSRTISKITWRSNKVTGVEVSGSTPALAEVGNYQVETGRFINSDDSLRRHSVCVIGGYVVDNLFPHEIPLGKRLVLDGKSYVVVGVLARKGSFLGQSQDNAIIVPITTFEKDFAPGRGIGELMYSISVAAMPRKSVPVEKAIDEVRELMRRRHRLGYDKPDDFGISTQDTIRDIYRSITRVAYLVMVAVAAISLLVGGIGIMNIMLVAVAERTREIGLRKALGATNQDVLWQFLLEAVMLSLVGGAIGVALGLGIAKVVELAAHLKAAAPLWTVLVGVGFSAGVGIFFGIYPASRAARLNPIEALRYE
ncbi:FtsX-like permease family protein [candidate division WOR-3 bacterium]|uniref:FtsX-like permease family protein n=1 Tax=candidate division WOR-3 bacterium TaxID=2052148 RepID=A0A938BR82_UNCW3|nr:FtsX-like permease family protein [candidate division WOR-3 bacterium]